MPPSTVTKTILIVEDDPAAQYIFDTALRHAGYRTVVAPDSDSVLNRLDELEADLIIMDLGLPGAVDGFDLTALLRQDPRTRDIPILVITVFAFEDDARRAREAGCTSFITKPVEPRAVLAEIERLLGAA